MLYYMQAALKLLELELRFRELMKTYPKLSHKMGIMCDADQVANLPSQCVPLRINGFNDILPAYRPTVIYVMKNEDEMAFIPGADIYEYGNEIENPAVTPKPLSVPDYISRLIAYRGSRPFSNPGLVSLNQNKTYWRQLIDSNLDGCVDYLSIHLYGQNRKLERIDNTWVEKKWYRKISDKWEWLKLIAAMLEFKNKTTKPIIVTECGVTSLTAEVPADVLWMDLVLNEIFGSRLIAACWYNLVELTDYPGKAILAYCYS